MELRNGPMVNNYPTRSWNAVHTGFTAPEFPNAHTYAFGVNDPPTVEPSLVGFEKWLPDYLNDLNAMQAAVESLSGIEQDTFSGELCRVVYPSSPFQELATYEVVCATAAQRAEAFLRTIGKWEESKGHLKLDPPTAGDVLDSNAY